jgi:hypothetical protein
MLPPFEVKCIASASRRRADPLHCRAASLINVLIVPASFSGSRGGTVIADASNPLNLIVHLCGKISHTKKKVGLCPTGQPAVILYESRIPDIEAGLASADRRIEAARAMARLLRPLVRLCIRSGMTFPALAQLLRELMCNSARVGVLQPPIPTPAPGKRPRDGGRRRG